MKKQLHFWLINSILSAFFMSCNNGEDGQIGLKSENSLLNAQVIDTFTVEFQSVFEKENIVSEGTNLMLAGIYSDSKTGTTTSSSSFQFINSENKTIPESAVCDSAILALDIFSANITNSDGSTETVYSYYGDSTTELSFSIHELTDDILIDKIYNTTDLVTFDENALVTSTPEAIFPGIKNIMNFNLGTTYGQRVVEALAANNGNNTGFLSTIKGLHIKPVEASSGSTIGFHEISESTKLTVYYSSDGTQETVDLTIADFAKAFNTVSVDFTGTELSSLSSEGDTISSKSTSNQMFMQASSGLRTKMTIPHFNEFLAENPNILVNNVTLQITIDPGSTTGGFADAPTSRMSLYETQDNLILRSDDNLPISVVNEGDQFGFEAGNSYFSLNTDTYIYTINLGLYTQEYIAERSDQPYDFILSPFVEGGNISRSIFNDTENTEVKSSFKIYYTVPAQE